ncbi:uncharacterized protein LOC108451148 [Gossypium arboreum]|uniref:uncharacterized protein LOC108451148 n=1 Tax=Gossypium arboreum TaxID=29729 RepID=UPI0008192E4F|nr:uncharacterized protein LOC108451148 [Gossypium arboreum]
MAEKEQFSSVRSSNTSNRGRPTRNTGNGTSSKGVTKDTAVRSVARAPTRAYAIRAHKDTSSLNVIIGNEDEDETEGGDKEEDDGRDQNEDDGGNEDKHMGGGEDEEDEDDGHDPVQEQAQLIVRRNPTRIRQPPSCGTHSAQ